MSHKNFYYIWTLLLTLLLTVSCTTKPGQIETPTGPVSGELNGPFQVLGVISRVTYTNQPNAGISYHETVHVQVPPGTVMIVPAVKGYISGFGAITDADADHDGELDSFTWTNHPDHHLGVMNFGVRVLDINAVDTSATPPTQNADVEVTMILSDTNRDDAWFGAVGYNLICLGRPKT